MPTGKLGSIHGMTFLSRHDRSGSEEYEHERYWRHVDQGRREEDVLEVASCAARVVIHQSYGVRRL